MPGNAIEAGSIPPSWCLRCGGLWLTDAVSNVLLFTPFGLALSWCLWRVVPTLKWPAVWVFAAGLSFSLLIESLQSRGIPPGRSAALADVATNSVGTLFGFLLWRQSLRLLLLRGRAAAGMGLIWAMATALVLTLTSVALGPRTSLGSSAEAVANPLVLSRSELTHVPNNPWYEASNDSARVNGFLVKRGWGGPIIISASHESLHWRASSTVRGFDPLGSNIPLLFVHVEEDSSPMLMLSEHGRDAELAITRRAWDWGLAVPVLRLKGAFAGRSINDARPLVLEAEVTSARLILGAASVAAGGEAVGVTGAAAGSGPVSLALVPTLGWAMLQTLVAPDSPRAGVVLLAWLLVLYAPLGWWATRAWLNQGSQRQALSGSAQRVVVAAVILAVVLALLPALVLPRVLGVAALPGSQWATMLMWLMVGALAGSLVSAKPALPQQT